MSISRTTLVGVFAILSVGILVWGYTYLKGKNLFSSSTQIYVEYNEVDGLATSAPVKVNGFKIGIVSKVYLKEDYSGKIMVVLDISEPLSISKTGAVARIVSSSIMGGKEVILDFPKKVCSGDDCLMSGDTIRGEVLSLISSMTSEFDPYIARVEHTFEVIDSMLRSWGTEEGMEAGVGKALYDVQEILGNLNATSRGLNGLMGTASGRINGVLGGLETVSQSLSESDADIKQTLRSTATLTTNLSKADLNGTLQDADKAIGELQQTLQTVDAAVQSLNAVLVKANDKNGTLGLLLEDDKLYQDLDKSLKNLDLLLEDVRKNPARYTRILSRNRAPYEENK